ncbi:hypothetical protein D3C73_1407460 [compost metagenome]
MVELSVMKEKSEATAIGTPILWPPPITTVTVGLDKEAIISAIASPASTSPPTVLSIIKSPSIRGFCSAATS